MPGHYRFIISPRAQKRDARHSKVRCAEDDTKTEKPFHGLIMTRRVPALPPHIECFYIPSLLAPAK